jgi:hypothetical protein
MLLFVFPQSLRSASKSSTLARHRLPPQSPSPMPVTFATASKLSAPCSIASSNRINLIPWQIQPGLRRAIIISSGCILFYKSSAAYHLHAFAPIGIVYAIACSSRSRTADALLNFLRMINIFEGITDSCKLLLISYVAGCGLTQPVYCQYLVQRSVRWLWHP